MSKTDYILIALIIITLISVLALIMLYRPNKKKAQLIKTIPGATKAFGEKLLENDRIRGWMVYLTTSNGIEDDSVEGLYVEALKSVFLALGLLVGAVIITGQWLIAIALALFLIVWPFLRRYLDKRSFRKEYIKSFTMFLNYVTLYLSGGVQMKQALIEVYKIMPSSNEFFKKRLMEVISTNALIGLSGDAYISTLEQLNEGLNFYEINSFISLAKRSQKRGDPISELLLDQISDITKKIDVEKHAYISSQDATFSIAKIVFGLSSTMLMFLIPLFTTSVVSIMNL